MELLVPPKREVLVYAPLSKKQEELYKMTVDKTINSWIVAKKVMMSFYPITFHQHGENLKFKKRACSLKQGKLTFAVSYIIRVPTRTGKMGRHFTVRENHTKYWKSQGNLSVRKSGNHDNMKFFLSFIICNSLS